MDVQLPVVLKREALYELVWAEPVRTVARRHGVSDVALAKACRKMHIPLPERGHWAKVAAGKKAKRPNLPALKQGEPVEYRLPRVATIQATLPSDVMAVLNQELAPENHIEVAEQLADPHPLVQEAHTVLGKAKPIKGGLLQRLDRRCLDLQVSPALLDRSLRIMDALLKALEKRGYSLDWTPPQKVEKKYLYGPSDWVDRPPRTFVKIGPHQIAFALLEETEFIHPPLPRPPSDAPWEVYWKWRKTPLPPRKPTGALTLTMKDVSDVGRKSWTDGKPKRLEDCLNMFVRALLRASEVLERKRLEREERERQRKAEAEERQRQEKVRREEADRVERLDKHLQGWRLARDIREFVKAAKALPAASSQQLSPDTELYLSWALARADRADPLSAIRHNRTAEIHEEEDEKDDP